MKKKIGHGYILQQGFLCVGMFDHEWLYAFIGN